MQTIILSTGEEVVLIEKLTWGKAQKIESALMDGAKIGSAGFMGYDASAILEGKYKAMEICIQEIKLNGESKPFSREWVDDLSIEDGNAVYEAVDALTKKK